MKRLLIIYLTALVLSGCSLPLGYNKFTMTNPVGYNKFTMTNPVDNQSVKDDTIRYADDRLDIIFMILKDSMFAGVENDGFTQYWQYRSIVFTLINKTDEVIVINWNKISFKDYIGNSGPIMHQGIKYSECSNVQASLTIPPKGKLADVITPCNSLKFIGAGSLSRWESSILPSPRKLSKPQFGIFMPLQIGDKVINYTFEFQAE